MQILKPNGISYCRRINQINLKSVGGLVLEEDVAAANCLSSAVDAG